MPSTASPFGFQVAKHPSGIIRPAAAYPDGIASGYGSAIYAGMPVILNTNGTLVAGTAAADILGIFAGVEFDPSDNGPRKYLQHWPANQAYVAGSCVAYIHTDPALYFKVQSDATLAATAVGDQADVSNVANGSTTTGLSTATLGTLVGVGVQGQFRIMELSLDVDNAWGDLFVNVLVQIARHQYVANKVAI